MTINRSYWIVTEATEATVTEVTEATVMLLESETLMRDHA